MDFRNWDQEIYNQLINQIDPFIKNACQFKIIYYLPISGYQGIGLINNDNLPDWYKQKSLIQTLIEINMSFKSNPVHPLIESEFNKFIAEIKVLWCENVITQGYECMIHYCGDEYEVIIEKIFGQQILRKKKIMPNVSLKVKNILCPGFIRDVLL